MANWFLDVLGVTDGTVLDNFASFLIFPLPSMLSLHTPKTIKKNMGIITHHAIYTPENYLIEAEQ